ncbi:uncharacterized protein LOC110686985 [Chenopodium quinoa]|uniref:uncharacterized protein LOC110686985 n=1 Tax=Chenopodium quinoa TaxID=63459 RepID=UPI000B77BE2B|nr:uncharacterized protein LOC110686985 [Chenopodium quinoa]
MPRRAITPCHTPSLLLFDPPTGLDSEMDFTQFEYLFVGDDGEVLATLFEDTNSALILHPNNTDNDLFNSLFMREIGSVDVPRPAHFLNIHDNHPIRHEFEVFLLWCLGSLPPSTFNPTNMKPAMHILEPKPVINFDCPVWPLDLVSMCLCIGAFTDTFQVCNVPPTPHILHMRVIYKKKQPENVPGYHMVDFTPYDAPDAEHVISGYFATIPLHTVVCTWNVRGIGRPSLVTNFEAMYKKHKPMIVVLLETRHGYETVRKLVKLLPGNYSFGLSTPQDGLCGGGGVVYMWTDKFIGVEPKGVYDSSARVDVYFKVTNSLGVGPLALINIFYVKTVLI